MKLPVHNPRWQYDCTRCKFKRSHCCGPCCACFLEFDPEHLGDPPRWRQQRVDQQRIGAGYMPLFRQRALDRLCGDRR